MDVHPSKNAINRYWFIAICRWYPLVNIQTTMENHHFQWENPRTKSPFSIAMLVYQRVNHGIQFLAFEVVSSPWSSFAPHAETRGAETRSCCPAWFGTACWAHGNRKTRTQLFWDLPSGYVKIAIEHGHLLWIFPLKMVIFHSYVKLPEGIFGFTNPKWGLNEGLQSIYGLGRVIL